MDVVLVRHAIAVERGTSGFEDDRARPLTADGRRRMKEAAQGLRELVAIDGILSSPLLRARQTADILGDAYGMKPAVLDALGMGDHPGTLAAVAQANRGTVALVGHQPWMSELLSVMVAGDPQAVFSEFKKGAAALVSFDGAVRAGGAGLLWLIQPGPLRRLARGSHSARPGSRD